MGNSPWGRKESDMTKWLNNKTESKVNKYWEAKIDMHVT